MYGRGREQEEYQNASVSSLEVLPTRPIMPTILSSASHVRSTWSLHGGDVQDVDRDAANKQRRPGGGRPKFGQSPI